MDVAAGIVAGADGAHALHEGQVGAGQVGRAADQFGRRRHQRLQHLLARLPCGELRLGVGDLLLQRRHRLVPVVRQLAGDRALELGAHVVVAPGASARRGGRRRRALPAARHRSSRSSGTVNGGSCQPSAALAAAASSASERRTVRCGGARLGRRAEADDRCGRRSGSASSSASRTTAPRLICCGSWPSTRLRGPAVRGEALHHVVRVRQRGVAVDRDVVVVVQDGQLGQAADDRRARRPRG